MFAEGLQNILYRCPVCGSEFSFEGKGHFFTCTKCGSVYEYREDGNIVEKNNKIEPTRIDKWSNSEKIYIKNEVQDEKFFMEDDVDLLMPNKTKNGYTFICHGHIKMDRNSLVFEAGEIKDENILYIVNNDLNGLEPLKQRISRLDFPLKNYDTIANIPGYSIDMCDNDYSYRLVITSRPSAAKYALAIEAPYN